MFTAVAVASLAFGIGANTAVFTLTDQILLRLMPVKNPQELVHLAGRGNHYGSNRGGNALSYPMYKDFRGREDVFGGVLCRFDLAGSGDLPCPAHGNPNAIMLPPAATAMYCLPRKR